MMKPRRWALWFRIDHGRKWYAPNPGVAVDVMVPGCVFGAWFAARYRDTFWGPTVFKTKTEHSNHYHFQLGLGSIGFGILISIMKR